jgi:predicted permease
MNAIGTPIAPLLKVVFASILEVFVLCLSGYILAGRGVLDKKTQKQINRLNVSLFTPALLFSKVAFFLSPEKLKELWIIPIYFTAVTLVSMTVAFVLGTLCQLKKSQRSFAMAAAMFMNSNSLPIALMQSLVLTVPDLKWGEDDNKNIMLGRALTYLVLYSTLGMVIRWSYGVKLLCQADDDVQDSARAADDERRPLLSSYEGRPTSYTQNLTDSSNATIGESEELSKAPIVAKRRKHPRHAAPHYLTPFTSFPNSPTMSRCPLSEGSESTSATVSVEPSDDEDYDPLRDSERQRQTSLPIFRRAFKIDDLQQQERSIKRSFWRAIAAVNSFMSAPLWAAGASLVVACIPSLQHTLEQHMKPIKGAISSAGQCSIPLTLVVLGAYFYPLPNEDEKDKMATSLVRSKTSFVESLKSCLGLGPPDDTRVDKRPGETKTVVVSIASRMFITPLIILPLLAIGAKFDVHDVFSDPVFVVSNVLLLASPPALTLAQITQAASGDAFERLISRTIFWAYCVVTPPMTIVIVVIGLILAKL